MPIQKVDAKFILKQSLKIFRSKGYNHTSMQDIALACGLTKGSLYHHFPGKKQLMKAVIKYMHNYFSKEAFGHAYDEQLGGKQKLQLLADIGESQYFASDYGCLFGNLALETAGNMPELFEEVKSFFDEWTAALTHIFSERYPAEEAKIIAQDSVAQIQGAVMMMRIYSDKQFLKRTHEKIIRLYEKAPCVNE